MSSDLPVSIEVLRTAANILFDHLQENEGGEIFIKSEYFWTISPEQEYRMESEPDSFTVGQLTDSYENVEGIFNNPARATAYAFVWLSDLLRAVGQDAVA